MITEQDLRAAIAECKGKRNPDANTCVKLAAFYIVRDHLYPAEADDGYSCSPPPNDVIEYSGDSEFVQAIRGLDIGQVIGVMDEAMEALQVLNPKFYASVIRKIQNF